MTEHTPSFQALGHQTADKRMEILRLIGEHGSISQAARRAGVSYKAAWQAVHTLTNLAGVALLDRAVGGAGGGGARLTLAGQQLLEAASQMASARREVQSRFSGGAAQALSASALRTSMRNQLPCHVTQCNIEALQDPMALVVLGLPQGGVIRACVTLESAQLLGLHAGLAVLALCKATAVVVKPGWSAVGQATVNQLCGRVTRIARGRTRDELVLALPGELQLVGFADQPNRLRVGSKVTACLDDHCVVLALV